MSGSEDADDGRGSPFAPHTAEETAAMLDAIGVDSEAELFDIPDSVGFDGELGIEARSERAVREESRRLLGENDDLVEFLGRNHYGHYVPSIVDHLSLRQEFLTSYTQYQPEVTQGFLQALFEYQSLLAELTGLDVPNASMYDAATALGEAATLATRVRSIDGDRVLVPDLLRDGRREVLANYAAGANLTVETYPTDDANVDVDALAELADEETAMIYAENPTVRGTIEENLDSVGELADEVGAMFCLGSDPVALSLLEAPASVGVDVVVGDASALGMPTSYGMGLGLFVTTDEYLRQVPGRLVGASTDDAGNRAYTLTLQTREQHIRRERATSNICTNQAWVALRAAIHAASLGPTGLVELAEDCVRDAESLAAELDALDGVTAPVHDRHHFREFVARTEQPAEDVRSELEAAGYAVHAIDDQLVQICVTDLTADATEEFVAAFEEVTG